MAYTNSQVMMTLAAITYAPAEDIGSYLLPTTNPPNATNGDWTLVWGPTVTAIDKGNLMFVAYNGSTNQYTIAVRGTYPYFSLALLVDLYQDLDVSHPHPWEYPSVSGALVAGGTIDGLNDLVAMSSDGVAFHTFIESKIAPSGADIFVTGHSLGGALTTVLAPWLVYRLSQINAKNAVLPYTYAGPTAGNTAFASFYTGLFKNSSRYYNVIDIVPKAWADLSSIKNLYSSPGPACPWELKDTIGLTSDWLKAIKVSYTQPNGAGESLPGVPSPASDFFAEALDQHDHNYYLKLLGAPTVPITAPGASAKKKRHQV
ncbi:MAG TPA: lipase family protein [Candidatus Binatia bacterium]|nr:lipase family protein [Candidatus Binatia bacterium]